MAESDTILQLGIEAAREGNRDEARNLFSLLTRQEPDNVQAWLWLAGVAENQDERRGALERVVALDPQNEMARKGLQAMNVDPDTISRAETSTPTVVPTPVAPVPVAEPDLSDEERYAAELDNAFDDYDAVEKVGGSIRNEPTSYRTDDDEDAATVAAGVGGAGYSGRNARERIEERRTARARMYDDDDDQRPARRGPSLIALILGGVILVLLLGLLWQAFQGRNNGTQVAGNPTAETAGTVGPDGAGAVGGATGTATTDQGGGAVGGTGEVTGTGTLTDTGAVGGTGATTDTGTTAGTEPPPADQGQQPAPPATGSFPDPATANPQAVAIGTTLEANGFAYTFPNATYAAGLGSSVGSVTSTNGRFVVVLMFVSNNTGTDQVIPGDLFVLKDAQGRVYTTNSAASEAYVIPGVNADLSLEDSLPANGVAYSTALVFDVAPDATNLVLFTRPRQDQGFQVLNSVP